MTDHFDADDRKRCTCRHLPTSPFPGTIGRDGKVRCLNLTRHPSGKCGDCRAFARGRRNVEA